MNVALTLTPHVRADLAEARIWYDQRRASLGDEFAAEFYAALEFIQRAPTAQTRASARFRKRRLKIFPYVVYFHLDENVGLFVVALVHKRRSPEFVTEQLQRR